MNLFKGLMFLEGHFTRPEDIDDDFAPLGKRVASRRWQDAHAGAAFDPAPQPRSAGTQPPAPRLLQDLWLLGGGPRQAGHSLHVDESREPRAAASDGACAAGCG